MNHSPFAFANRLFLASGSGSRKKLLQESGFEVVVLEQTFDEYGFCWDCDPKQLITALAAHKMDHVIMPDVATLRPHEHEKGIFVVTADTVVVGIDGTIYGKSESHEEAVETIKNLRAGSWCMSAFCVELRRCDGSQWLRIGEQMSNVDAARVHFEIEDEWIEKYLQIQPIAYKCAGSMAIEGCGALFLTGLEGSYATVIGLPLYQLRQSLDTLGFFG